MLTTGQKRDSKAQQEAAKRANSQLCHRCLKVELQPEKLSRPNRYLDHEWSLGTFKDVLARPNSPLCRLVVAAITGMRPGIFDANDEQPFGTDPSEEVLLEWDRRLGFSVNLAMPGCRISFVDGVADEDANDDDTEVPLRRVQDHSKPFSHPNVFGDWLSSCQEYHGAWCAYNPPLDNVSKTFRSGFPTPMNYVLRFVDVKSYSIVDAPDNGFEFMGGKDYGYIALSYVWGGVTALQLLRNNKEELMKSGSLRHHWCEIPQTIKDTIHLARQMNVWYLWVDALCLVQDDETVTMAGSEMDERDGLSAMQEEWDLYWVMLIHWDADGVVAERRGLGQIYQKAVGMSVAPVPSWKEIVLG